MDKTTDLLSTEEAIICRIRFRRDLPHERHNISSEEWFKEGPDPADNFNLLFLPDAPSTADLRKKTEEWFNELRGNSREPAIELFSKPYRILWHSSRAVVSGGDRLTEEVFSALTEFAFLEGELRKLESKVAAHLAVCQNDIPLTHAINTSDLPRQNHANKMTEQITFSRMEFLHLTPCFDNLHGRLTPQAKYVIGELTEKTGVWDDRIEAVEDQLEFLGDLYELANDRLTEFSYFRREAMLELWIIVLLVLEFVVMFWEAYMLLFHGSS